ncbi:hypothetical protein FIBSPDRAFT_899352 [Athelia psychrophila]|uniref:Uncharacterized protein n=1 Tax=Athelia psychrophila TaxID=1759441 RepID=A0A165ZTB0_9AGAM|nr:hypothetical protein FIBSPDRAFT_899352 [Fibularhizoctonia sp. CBS 109695]
MQQRKKYLENIENRLVIPKLHSILHYIQAIRQLGSADGFNTEAPERLHIEYAKKAYAGSSRTDYIAQMKVWLHRQEAIDRHAAFLAWVEDTELDSDTDEVEDALTTTGEDDPQFKSAKHVMRLAPFFTPSGLVLGHGYRVPKGISFSNVSVDQIENDFSATTFLAAFQTYLSIHHPHATLAASRYDRFNLYNSLTILLPIASHVSHLKRLNKIRAAPQIPSKSARKPPKSAVADTVLVVEDAVALKASGGLNGLRVAQVHAIFTLPAQYGTSLHPLAYVEWFRPLRTLDSRTGFHRQQRSTAQRQRLASIISVDTIWRACHLAPRFGSAPVDCLWVRSNVLEVMSDFVLNPYINHYVFHDVSSSA